MNHSPRAQVKLYTSFMTICWRQGGVRLPKCQSFFCNHFFQCILLSHILFFDFYFCAVYSCMALWPCGLVVRSVENSNFNEWYLWFGAEVVNVLMLAKTTRNLIFRIISQSTTIMISKQSDELVSIDIQVVVPRSKDALDASLAMDWRTMQCVWRHSGPLGDIFKCLLQRVRFMRIN